MGNVQTAKTRFGAFCGREPRLKQALTCNALEWKISQGGGWLLKSDGTLSLQRAPMVEALERARRWIGTLSPPEVTAQLEDDSLRMWKNGDAAFMRNWPYAYVESMRSDSPVRNRVGVTLVPKGDGSHGRHADILGGFPAYGQQNLDEQGRGN
jgi:trehalose/maltose transport system substrate-binding protein